MPAGRPPRDRADRAHDDDCRRRRRRWCCVPLVRTGIGRLRHGHGSSPDRVKCASRASVPSRSTLRPTEYRPGARYPTQRRPRCKQLGDGRPGKGISRVCPGATPCSLRHATATVLEEGLPLLVVSDLLGRSSTKVTEDVHRHDTPRLTAHAAAALDRALYAYVGDQSGWATSGRSGTLGSSVSSCLSSEGW